MGSKGIANWTLVLRIFTFLSLAACVVVLLTNHFKQINGRETTFKDVIAYRYVISVACIGQAYTLVQLPFAFYYAHKEKRLIRNECLPDFDFYADKIISFLLATGVGVGFAVSLELKKLLNELFKSVEDLGLGLDDSKSRVYKFLDMGYVATSLLFLGFLCMAILSVLSSINRNPS